MLRRKKLVEQTQSAVLLIAAFEESRYRFLQDPTFYYYTGVNEPGAACIINPDGTSVLYIPQYATHRAQWIPGSLQANEQTAEQLGFEKVEHLGERVRGYSLSFYFEVAAYTHIIAALENICKKYDAVYASKKNYVIDSLSHVLSPLQERLRNVDPFVARMRRSKSKEEIQLLHQAIDVTISGQEAAARAIKSGINECQVAAAVQYVFAESNAEQAFPTIIGSGVNATVLHYNDNCRDMHEGEGVIVDIGACLNHYCGDLTRTYPVSGKFSKQQKDIYNAVLQAQEFVAETAMPGFWLRNDEVQEKSLYHLMYNFLKERKLEQYIVHGVGHFLGLEVHDVGDLKEPLQEGDVITIEPGVYIPEGQGRMGPFGVRIEDNYWIVQDGAVCLSGMLPKEVDAVEDLVQQNF